MNELTFAYELQHLFFFFVPPEHFEIFYYYYGYLLILRCRFLNMFRERLESIVSRDPSRINAPDVNAPAIHDMAFYPLCKSLLLFFFHKLFSFGSNFSFPLQKKTILMLNNIYSNIFSYSRRFFITFDLLVHILVTF